MFNELKKIVFKVKEGMMTMSHEIGNKNRDKLQRTKGKIWS